MQLYEFPPGQTAKLCPNMWAFIPVLNGNQASPQFEYNPAEPGVLDMKNGSG